MEKVVIVTGASRGIGREIAKELTRRGMQVIAGYNNSEKEAIELKIELEKEGLFIDIYKVDVSKRENVKQLVEYTLNKYKKIDVLINNAGISQYKLFVDITDEEWNNIINTNLYSVFCTTQEVLKNMICNKQGCIINISSVWGIVGASCESAYAVSKAGIDSLTKSLAKELSLSNIRVNSIAPGCIETDMLTKNLDKQELKELENEIPLGRIGKSFDIAKCVNWLIEDNYTTGQVISINGGFVI